MSKRKSVPDGLLWFGLLAAPLAWGAQLVLGYGSEETTCSSPGRSETVAGLELEQFVTAVSVVAALVALAGLIAAVGTALAAPSDDALGRIGFMARGGILVSAVFLGAILLAGAAAFALSPCEAG
jgi:hypothetical protein